MKLKLGLGIAVVVIMAALIGIILSLKPEKVTRPLKTAAIPVGSTTAVAKTHAAKGSIPNCRVNVASAEAAVRADDYLIDDKFSAFDIATTMGIIDVPAGTNVDEFIQSYDGKTVTGSIAYEKDYGTYNFIIVPSSNIKPYQQWTMTSLIACGSRIKPLPILIESE